MNIQMIEYEGGTCPMFVCDQCQEPIIGSPALVLYRWEIAEPTADFRHVGPYYVVHQGDCDHQFSKGKPKFWWRTLTQFVNELHYNVCVDPSGAVLHMPGEERLPVIPRWSEARGA